MDTGGPRSGDGDQRFKSTDGYITADGKRLWRIVIAVAALTGAVGLGAVGAALAVAVARLRGRRTVPAAAAGALWGAGLGGALGWAHGWFVGAMVTLAAERAANETSEPRREPQEAVHDRRDP